MNLVSVPFYAAGNFTCDILNNTSNLPDIKGGFGNSNHVHILGREIYDKDGEVYVKFASLGKYLTYKKTDNVYIATHDYPTMEDCKLFDNIIVINLTTEKSLLYRFARIYNQHFYGKTKFLRKFQIEPIQYMNPMFPKFYGSNVVNFEFEDLVEWKGDFIKFLEIYKDKIDMNNLEKRKKDWQELNRYLYDTDFLKMVSKFISNYNQFYYN